jgi:hypothetical protein
MLLRSAVGRAGCAILRSSGKRIAVSLALASAVGVIASFGLLVYIGVVAAAVGLIVTIGILYMTIVVILPHSRRLGLFAKTEPPEASGRRKSRQN